MKLHDHAKAIEDAIQAAYDDGFELDNGNGYPIRELDLNSVDGSEITDWAPINIPPANFE